MTGPVQGCPRIHRAERTYAVTAPELELPLSCPRLLFLAVEGQLPRPEKTMPENSERAANETRSGRTIIVQERGGARALGRVVSPALCGAVQLVHAVCWSHAGASKGIADAFAWTWMLLEPRIAILPNHLPHPRPRASQDHQAAPTKEATVQDEQGEPSGLAVRICASRVCVRAHFGVGSMMRVLGHTFAVLCVKEALG